MTVLRGIIKRQSRLCRQNRLRPFWTESIGQGQHLQINQQFNTPQ